jgi:hypothetical protein
MFTRIHPRSSTYVVRDDNFIRGCGYPTRRVRVLFFTCGPDPYPPHESAVASFIFHLWVTRGYLKFQILMVLT